MNTWVVILAAGLGTRMRSRKAKVLHRAGGLSLVEQVVRAATAVTDTSRIVVVTGHQADSVEAVLRPYGVGFARQTEQKGTGHALACCRDAVKEKSGRLMVLYGDTPLLSANTLRTLLESHTAHAQAATLMTTEVANPHGYGRVVLNDRGHVAAIVEHKDCTPAQLEIRLINSGIYCFDAQPMWQHLSEIVPNAKSGEYYLTDMAEIFGRHGLAIHNHRIEDPRELLGINTRIELAEADAILRERKNRELMLSGVTIEKPETVTIDLDVEVGCDTVIEPFVRLLGHTKIGEDCRIGTGSILENAHLESNTEVGPYTLVADSKLESGAQAGPFSRLRMHAVARANSRIGNFVELKNTELGAGSKSQHLAYLGDTSIGAGSNIGAGTITCNYDGAKKHRTTIGDDVFVGSNSTLVAPVTLSDNSYVAAGSVVTHHVPSDALAVGRSRQENKAGWVSRRKPKKG